MARRMFGDPITGKKDFSSSTEEYAKYFDRGTGRELDPSHVTNPLHWKQDCSGEEIFQFYVDEEKGGNNYAKCL